MSGHARDVFAPDFHLRRLCRRAAFVTACSQHARAHLGRLFDASLDGRTFCCHHGVDLGVFDPLPRNAGVLVQPVRLLSVCRLVDKKGVDVILNALYLLKQRGGRFICTIVGDGPQKASLRRLNQRLGLSEVHFAGTLDHGAVRALYAEADLFVLGCRTAADGDRDGIPNVILEAMASGVPIIASSAGAVAEVVRHRDTGFLIPPDDPFMMADAIEELSDDINLRVAIVRNARVEVERRFDLRVNAASLISHLEYALRQPCRDFESCT
jgi:glycosyltransferase involved in cell wall biosynthesis